MPTTLKDTEKVLLTATFFDQQGNPTPAPAGQAVTWQTTDATICAIQPVAASATAWAVAQAKLGNAVVTALCAGMQATYVMTVVAGDPVSMAIVAGTPAHQ